MKDGGVEKIFAVINQMEADGVIGRYAIGGAVGAISGWNPSRRRMWMCLWPFPRLREARC